MNIKPLGERVVLKQIPQEEKTEGGIYIPAQDKNDKKEGEVVAVGTTQDGKTIDLPLGSRVIYSGYSSTDVDSNGETYTIVEYKDIVAIYG